MKAAYRKILKAASARSRKLLKAMRDFGAGRITTKQFKATSAQAEKEVRQFEKEARQLMREDGLK